MTTNYLNTLPKLLNHKSPVFKEIKTELENIMLEGHKTVSTNITAPISGNEDTIEVFFTFSHDEEHLNVTATATFTEWGTRNKEQYPIFTLSNFDIKRFGRQINYPKIIGTMVNHIFSDNTNKLYKLYTESFNKALEELRDSQVNSLKLCVNQLIIHPNDWR